MGRLTLVYTHPETGEQRIEIADDCSYRIGSQPDNDIVIASNDISRHHAILRMRQGTPHITDLNSKNGTFINGRRTASSNFRIGDTVHLSSIPAVVEEEGSEEPVGVTAESGGEGVTDADRSDPEETQAFSGQASAEEMVSLLVTTSGAVRRGAVVEPLAWAVEHLGLDAAVVLYRDDEGGVSMVSSAGQLGDLVRSSETLTRIAREQEGQYSGTRISQLDESEESLLVAPIHRQHVLVVPFTGAPPPVGDIRAVMASVEAVLGSGNPPAPAGSVPGDRRDPELRRFGSPLHRIAGLSDSINECKLRTAEIARSDRAVLISGESGTGKSLFARVIHDLSSRQERPFVVLGGAITGPDGTAESRPVTAEDVAEAVSAANGGTLFVRDLCALTSTLQDLLVAEFHPTGSSPSSRSVGVRPIFGAECDVSAALAEGELNESLAGAFGGFRIDLPPLREHLEDIPLLITHFQREAGGRRGKAGAGFTMDSLEALASYQWPDNVRELRAEVLRLMTRATSDQVVEVADLSPRIREGLASSEVPPLDLGALVQRPLSDAREDFERWMILRAMYAEDWNQTRAAKRLGLSRAGLFKKMRKLGLSGHEE